MCRFVAYIGEPVFLNEIVCEPAHSLLHQSLQAERAKMVTHGDGFGIGWYGDRPEPAVYREVMPAWSDENLLSLCSNVRSHLFFAHVRAATGTGIARQNCHPFRYGPYLFMHNGQIGGYGQIRRAMEARLPDHLYAERRGATDSELLFLLIIARIEAGQPVTQAVNQILNETLAMMHVLNIHEPLRFAGALADGHQVHAFRFSSDYRAPTLYLRQDADSGLVVASEPLADDQDGWTLIPPGSVVHLAANGLSSSEALM